MEPKKNYKVEDILSNGISHEESHLIPESEKILANEIKSAVKSMGKEELSSLETAQLWNRIQNSNVPKRFNWKPYLQIAAIFIMVSGIVIWKYEQNTNTRKLLSFATQNLETAPAANQHSSLNPRSFAGKNAAENIIATNGFNTLTVNHGKRSVIKLPDGTRVWLNSGSKLIYPEAFSNETREVYLEGEAYFDVTHDKKHPFHVRSKDIDIKVLGTEFYVSSNTENKTNYAVLIKGSIEFSSGSWLNKVERKLTPGERINYNVDENKFQVSHVNTMAFESWKAGYLKINSEPLDVIIQRVAKYYHIEINTGGLDMGKETFSGRLDFQKSADDVLAILCLGTPYTYNGTERRLELRKN
jgi:transmembrane sensor